jgi:hypothetical protein
MSFASIKRDLEEAVPEAERHGYDATWEAFVEFVDSSDWWDTNHGISQAWSFFLAGASWAGEYE